ncbi:Ig-like domain-containing protein [uncultured Methanobrevibacter sp.]|uniref:Ig-like domain-containing protein n=1 Tax=uncultured Methanobrevibacter sp. TaxID=253161 RepID=UPI0025CD2745|nr:Ig-like domain-containing protein [uncultured Methanobrevibacter sp.]
MEWILNDIIVNVTGLKDTETVIATGSVTIKVNGKEETIELVEGKATYTIAATDIISGENTVTVSYSGSDEFEAGTATASFKTLDGVVTNETFFDYFNRAENGRLYNYIPDGVTLDFQGAFYSTPERNFTMNINKPVNIITSTHDAFIDLNTTAGSLFGEDPGDSFAITYGGSGTNVTDIVFHNSQIWVFNAHNVTLDHINNTIEDQRVGSGNGATSIRANSTYVTVKNSYFYTRNNGGSSSLVMAWADHCTFDNNTIVVEGNVGNMIYLTTYNVEVPTGVLANQYNTITNNKIYGFKEPASICGGLVISGANNLIEGNFIDYGGTGINAQWGQGDFVNNTYRNNVLINGSSFNAPDGSTMYNNSVTGAMNTGKNSIAYNNTVGKNLTVGIGATAYDNTANGLIVNENGTAYDNIINGLTQVNGKNALVRDSELNGAVTLKGDNSKVLESIIVGDVTLSGNNTLLQGSDVDGNISFGTKSAGTATVNENNINGQITTKASNNNLVITNNVIHTDEEYAIVLKSRNNIVECNQLYAAEKKGEEAVSFDETKNNTVQKNYPPYMPKIEIETPVIWIGNSADIVITVSNLEGAETILATGNVTVKINGKEETIELSEGKATYTIPAEDITAGENTVTVTYNGADDFATGEESATFAPLDGVVTKDTFQYYFDEENNGALFYYVPEGATLDFQGDFIGAYTTNINKPVNIVSTTGDAFIETNKTGSFNILEGGSGTNVSGLSFLNTAFYITTAHNVVIDGISMVANMSGVGSGTGFLSIRSNSSYVTVKNSYFENGGTGSSCVVIGTSNYCTIDNNVLNATKNSGNILYITTYVGTGDTPSYNNITNNIIESQVNSGFCYAINQPPWCRYCTTIHLGRSTATKRFQHLHKQHINRRMRINRYGKQYSTRQHC